MTCLVFVTYFLFHSQLQEYFKCDITGTMINKATFQKPVRTVNKQLHDVAHGSAERTRFFFFFVFVCLL